MDTLELKEVDLRFIKNPKAAILQYVEFFVNDRSLIEIIEDYFQPKKTLLSKFTSVLGTMESLNFDRLKVAQLTNTSVDSKTIEQFFPAKHFDQEPIFAELQLPKTLLYCCAECGDFRCSGIFIKVVHNNKYVEWHIFEPEFSALEKTDTSKTLVFKFNAKEYSATFTDYLNQIKE